LPLFLRLVVLVFAAFRLRVVVFGLTVTEVTLSLFFLGFGVLFFAAGLPPYPLPFGIFFLSVIVPGFPAASPESDKNSLCY
jgi:hypothetical protein